MAGAEVPPSKKKQRRTNHVDSAAAAERRKRIDEERRQLPAWAAREQLLALLRRHRTVVLVGETGSGKTTQIPQFLLHAKFGGSGAKGSGAGPKPEAANGARAKAGAGGSGGATGSGDAGRRTDGDGNEGAHIRADANGEDGHGSGGGAGGSGSSNGGGGSRSGGGGGGGGGQCIAVTQPRRVAAMTVARRVAEEMGTKLGHKVGYAIRFEDVTSPATRIKYMTDGLLLREALIDPLLSRYRVVIIDEAHERTVHTDVLFGLLKGVQSRRGDDFRLIVMSATLDAARFVDYFPGAVAALVRGRQFPVQVLYTARPEDNYLDAAINATLQVHADEGEGDILVFLTGQDEIDSAERLIRDKLPLLAAAAGNGAGGGGGAGAGGLRELLVLPIYAALPPEQQMKVFEPAPAGTRKAILATNIAETSITIPGVRYVIDTGHVKARDYNAKLGLESLAVVPVSQAQARQRSGRAGREGPGKAYRLYTEASFSSLDPATPPEITRCNLASVVLQLKAMGITDVLGFDFMDPPPRTAILRSLELLFALGALDPSGCLTPDVGAQLSRLPVDPMFGRVLLAACGSGCGLEAAAVVAMVSAENVFHTPRQKEREWRAARLKFVSREGDHLTLLNVFRGFAELPKESAKARAAWCSDNFINIRALRKAEDIYSQLLRFLGPPCPPGLGLPLASAGDDSAPLRRALTAGLFPHAARLQPDGSYRVIATGRQVFLHPSSVLLDRKPDVLVFNELMHTTKTYARDATAVEARWLPELAPAFFAAKAAAATAGPSAAATAAR